MPDTDDTGAQRSRRFPFRFDSTLDLGVILTIAGGVITLIWAASGWKSEIDGKLDEHSRSFQRIEDRSQAVEKELQELRENYHSMDTRLTAQLAAVQATLGAQGSRDTGSHSAQEIGLPANVTHDLSVIASSSDKLSGNIDALRQAASGSNPQISEVRGKIENIANNMTDIKKNLQEGVKVKNEPPGTGKAADQAFADLTGFANSILSNPQLSNRQKTQILRELVRQLAQVEAIRGGVAPH